MFPSLRPDDPAERRAWLRRITAALAAVTGGVLAWAAAIPAASAAIIPGPARAIRARPAAPADRYR